jgi:23S rRNA pseudouridine1911/1915/1917 synthase
MALLEKEDKSLIQITENSNNQRLDKFLSDYYEEHSRTYIQYLLKKEAVLVNGKVAKKNLLLKQRDEIEIIFIAKEETHLKPEQIDLEILYEDDHIIAINKKPGMVVHPAPGNWSGTFVNALIFHCKKVIDIENSVRPGIVHRLDKDTSGILLAAKTEKAHRELITQFSKRTIEKKYLAICVGLPKQKRVNAPIWRHKHLRKEMTVTPDGKEAITDFETLAYNGQISFVLAKPFTGRTHQIRVHLKHINCPVLGDEIYGSKSVNKKYGIERQLLHAYQLSFIHPITKESVTITAPLPEDFKQVLKKLNYEFSI